jgi:vacuolar-type H+-ATPase catalytic subunit A/Vma1
MEIPDNTSSIPLAVREASTYMGITLGEHYRQMGLNALLTSLKRYYAARGSPECARYLARIDEPPKTLRRSAVPPTEVSI